MTIRFHEPRSAIMGARLQRTVARATDSLQPRDGMLVRPMRLADVRAVAAVDACGYSRPWAAHVFEDHVRLAQYRYWIAEADGIAVGYAGLEVATHGRVTTVTVHPSHRRRGVARALMGALLKWAARHSLEKVRLEVAITNQGARRLYERMGFVVVGVRSSYYGEHEDAVVMEVALDMETSQ